MTATNRRVQTAAEKLEQATADAWFAFLAAQRRHYLHPTDATYDALQQATDAYEDARNARDAATPHVPSQRDGSGS